MNEKQDERNRFEDPAQTEEGPASETDKINGKKKEKKEGIWATLRPCIITVLVVLFVVTFIARPSRIIGQSMEDTCHDGDFVILWEWNYDPQRGDIVVANSDNVLNENLIKRVIGVGGDHIEISGGVLKVNGEVQSEPYIKEQSWGEEGWDVDIVVPEGEVFLMGDNRNHSTDSRVIGTIPTKDIIGKVVVRLFPFTAITTF